MKPFDMTRPGHKCRSWLLGIISALVQIAAAAFGSTHLAALERPTCMLSIGSKRHSIENCQARDDRTANQRAITLAPKDLGSTRYFAYLVIDKRMPDRAEGFWNEEVGARHAHSPLGTLVKVGACWVNAVAKICEPSALSAELKSTAPSSNSCPANIDAITCNKAQALLREQVTELTAGNVSSELLLRLGQRIERPLRNTPCFYFIDEKLEGRLTKCILPRVRASTLPEQPIMLQASQFDACNQSGEIVGLDPHGDNYLAVKAGPSGAHGEKDRLAQGDRVWICGRQGSWIAVIYQTQGETCGVNTPARSSGAYRGPCAWGWAHRNYVKVTAG